MSQRYTRLFALPGCLCSRSAPAAILAGALLKDNETGEILAQLKLKNVQEKPIKALTISLQALDTAGQKLGSPVPYHYLDLSIPQDGEFGQKDAIVLPHVAPCCRTGLSAEGHPGDLLRWAPVGNRRRDLGKHPAPGDLGKSPGG